MTNWLRKATCRRHSFHGTFSFKDVLTNKLNIIRYLTLAHEIAHNLVESHNSEHEFYFSSICEAHMPALTRLLISAP